jgi:hypothetical protein
MVLLDFVDSIVTPSIKTSWFKPCTNLHYYQINDKISDLVTYLLLFTLLFTLVDYDHYLLIFILWRFIGVYLFRKTQNRNWLVPFLDFVKSIYCIFIYLDETIITYFYVS